MMMNMKTRKDEYLEVSNLTNNKNRNYNGESNHLKKHGK